MIAELRLTAKSGRSSYGYATVVIVQDGGLLRATGEELNDVAVVGLGAQPAVETRVLRPADAIFRRLLTAGSAQ